jgi:hypothetical protein
MTIAELEAKEKELKRAEAQQLFDSRLVGTLEERETNFREVRRMNHHNRHYGKIAFISSILLSFGVWSLLDLYIKARY